MDIAIMSTAISQFQVQQQAQLSVMNKIMDQAQANSDSLHKMLDGTDIQAMQQSVQPNLGVNIDVKA